MALANVPAQKDADPFKPFKLEFFENSANEGTANTRDDP